MSYRWRWEGSRRDSVQGNILLNILFYLHITPYEVINANNEEITNAFINESCKIMKLNMYGGKSEEMKYRIRCSVSLGLVIIGE